MSNLSAPLNPARDLSPRLFTAIAGWGTQVFSSDMGFQYTWFLVPLFAPYVGAIIGAFIYTLFIGVHLSEIVIETKVKKDKKEKKKDTSDLIYANYESSPIFKPRPQIKLAKFDDEIETERLQDYAEYLDTSQNNQNTKQVTV